MQPDLVTFGETMVILDPTDHGPLRYVNQFHKRFGGAESNVAIGVARLGHSSGWISQVGNDELGTYLVNSIRGEGVDTSQVSRTDIGPTGLFLKERLREGSTQVYYYRTGSAASFMHKNQVNWDYIKKAKIVHISGITPFLSESCYDLTMEIVSYAKKNQLFLSFDPNIRLKILKSIPNHHDTLLYLASQADLFMPGVDEAAYLFGDSSPDSLLDSCLKTGAKQVVLKNGSQGTYYATQSDQGFIKSINVDNVVDPIGAGDGFAAGVLSALLEKNNLRAAVQRGSIVGAMVISVAGDIEGLPTIEQIHSFTHTKSDVLR